jgi:hypothetical protein
VSIETAIPLQDFERTCLAARSSRPAFKGTITSACESIGLDNFIEMERLARTNDPSAERFMNAWDALDASEQQARGTADAICNRAGLAPIELLGIVADAAYRVAMYAAQIKAALALPSIVERSVDVALTDKGIADRKMLFQHSGFLPTPSGAQTNIAMVQNSQLNATTQPVITVAPRPEETLCRLSDGLNDSRAKMNGGEKADGN